MNIINLCEQDLQGMYELFNEFVNDGGFLKYLSFDEYKEKLKDEKEQVIAESGLVKPGEYLKSVSLNKKINKKDNTVVLTFEDYNKTIKSFPKNILAGMFGFEEKEYFEAKDSSNEVPNVSFE